MGAGILAAIAGGLSEASVGEAVVGSSSGIIYGTGAGYLSGIRQWGGVYMGGSIPLGPGGGYADVQLDNDFQFPTQGGSYIDAAILAEAAAQLRRSQ